MSPLEQLAWWLTPGIHEPPPCISEHFRSPREQDIALQSLEVQRLQAALDDAFKAWAQLGMEGIMVIKIKEVDP